MTSVSFSRAYTMVFVRTNSMTSTVTALMVGLARDVKQRLITAAPIFARTVQHATTCSTTISVSEWCISVFIQGSLTLSSVHDLLICFITFACVLQYLTCFPTKVKTLRPNIFACHGSLRLITSVLATLTMAHFFQVVLFLLYVHQYKAMQYNTTQ